MWPQVHSNAAHAAAGKMIAQAIAVISFIGDAAFFEILAPEINPVAKMTFQGHSRSL